MTIVIAAHNMMVADKRSSSLSSSGSVGWTDTAVKITDLRGREHICKGKKVLCIGISGDSEQNQLLHAFFRKRKGMDVEKSLDTFGSLSPSTVKHSVILVLCEDGFAYICTLDSNYSGATLSIRENKLSGDDIAAIGSGGALVMPFKRINPDLTLGDLFMLGSYLDNRSSSSMDMLDLTNASDGITSHVIDNATLTKKAKTILRRCLNIKEWPGKIIKDKQDRVSIKEHF